MTQRNKRISGYDRKRKVDDWNAVCIGFMVLAMLSFLVMSTGFMAMSADASRPIGLAFDTHVAIIGVVAFVVTGLGAIATGLRAHYWQHFSQWR